MKVKILFLVFGLLLACTPSSLGATISGQAFEWDTLEPLGEVIVEINTTPKQTDITENGFYSFSVPEGIYTVTAQFFEENRLKYEAEEKIEILQDGNFTIDLLLFPALFEESLVDEPELADLPIENGAEESTAPELAQFIFGLILIAIIIAALVFAPKKIVEKATGLKTENLGVEEKLKVLIPGKENRSSHSMKTETSQADKDLEIVLDLLKRYGGRMTQKELREKMPFGEAKVSLILAELEEMGKIKKFKKGRGNVIVLKG